MDLALEAAKVGAIGIIALVLAYTVKIESALGRMR
jgi:hypothetical protein